MWSPLHRYACVCSPRSHTQNGPGFPSPIVTGLTSEAAPDGPPRNLVIQVGVSTVPAHKQNANVSRAIDLSWAPPDRTLANGNVTSYYITATIADSRISSNVANRVVQQIS